MRMSSQSGEQADWGFTMPLNAWKWQREFWGLELEIGEDGYGSEGRGTPEWGEGWLGSRKYVIWLACQLHAVSASFFWNAGITFLPGFSQSQAWEWKASLMKCCVMGHLGMSLERGSALGSRGWKEWSPQRQKYSQWRVFCTVKRKCTQFRTHAAWPLKDQPWIDGFQPVWEGSAQDVCVIPVSPTEGPQW